MVVLAAAALCTARAEKKGRLKWTLASLWLLAVLLVSKNLGAVIITLLLLPLLFSSRRLALSCHDRHSPDRAVLSGLTAGKYHPAGTGG